MDSTRFDAITKHHARTRSRRQLVRALAAGTGIGVLTQMTGPVSVLSAPPKQAPKCAHRDESCAAAECCGQLVCDPLTSMCVRSRKRKPIK